MMSQKHIKDSERKYVKIVNGSGFAQRIAGSGCGQFGVCDVISVEDGQVYLDEVKSTSQEKLIVDSKMKEQLGKLIETARLNPPVKPRLVIHWKRRGWQIINLEEIPKSPIEIKV
jgi:Holliday junction resolvase